MKEKQDGETVCVRACVCGIKPAHCWLSEHHIKFHWQLRPALRAVKLRQRERDILVNYATLKPMWDWWVRLLS